MIEVVYFGAKWCMPCRTMHPILDKLEQEFSSITFTKIDVDESTQLVIDNKVSAVPTLIIFKDGTTLHRLVGMQSETSLRETLNKVL